MQLDVSNEEQIASAAQQVKQRLHGNENSSKGLDLLINCAGMLHPSGRGETSLRAVSHEVLYDFINISYIYEEEKKKS